MSPQTISELLLIQGHREFEFSFSQADAGWSFLPGTGLICNIELSRKAAGARPGIVVAKSDKPMDEGVHWNDAATPTNVG